MFLRTSTRTAAVGKILFLAAVRRVRRPGIKFDTMLVLESNQGKDKSKAFRALATKDEWFTDDLSLGAESKEFIEKTAGVWIVEFADLSGMGRRDVNHVKSLLSRQDDRARPAYGHRSRRVPRQFITVGTTNDAQYLLDDENRRFWPVAIERFDFEALTRDVAQLWAEAAAREAAGESIVLSEGLWPIAAEVQAERRVQGRDEPIYDRLVAKLGIDEPGWLSTADVWALLDDVPIDRQPGLAAGMGRAMRKLGFSHPQVSANRNEKGKRGARYYQRGEGDVRLP